MKSHSQLSQVTFFLSSILFLVIFTLSTSVFAEQKSVPNITASDKTSSLQENDINRFTNAISEIKEFYVKPIDDKKLLEDAIRGMLSGLDPHSEYLDESSYKTLLMSTSGEFAGLGIEVTSEFNVLKVVTPIDDTPAAKAGIKAGDYIVALDGKLVSEMSLNEAVDKMRGKKGTPITLTVIRKGEKNPLTFKMTRDIIHIASIKSKLMDGNFGYIRISQFQEPTTELMISAIESLKKQAKGNLKGLILDLRNNPGGLLETAVQVTDVFLNTNNLNAFNKVIVYTEGRLPKTQYSAKAKSIDILEGAPLVILINEGSASASEIVAGALQDYRRAIVIGTQSFGKGSVQTVIPLDDKHAIKLTTALYHTPSGRVIQNVGIVPDITVDNLKITNNSKVDTAALQPIREYELKGHLHGANSTSKNPDAINNEKDDLIALAQTDFQLYEALKIINTLYLSNTAKTTHILTKNE